MGTYRRNRPLYVRVIELDSHTTRKMYCYIQSTPDSDCRWELSSAALDSLSDPSLRIGPLFLPAAAVRPGGGSAGPDIIQTCIHTTCTTCTVTGTIRLSLRASLGTPERSYYTWQ